MSVTAVLPRADGVSVPRGLERVAAVCVFALAAALRVADAHRTPLDPFYDAAVRSMGASWHNLFVGALDPSGQVAIDKPPLDLWLQVASTKLLGFGPVALLLPAALAGTWTVIALYDLLRTLAGTRAALIGALALAVLPVAVVTARSDTMDSLLAALLVSAFAVGARGLRRGSDRHMIGAGALLGLAFEVKLFEAMIAAVPLAVLWWFGAPGTRGRRAAAIAGAAAACAVVGVAWLVAVTAFVPAVQRPWAFGSTDGSPWNAAFVYDGWDRLVHGAPRGLAPTVGGASRLPAAPGPLRLLSAQDGLGPRLGLELVAAWAALGQLAATRAWRALDRAGRAGLVALMTWLAVGTVLFSAQGSLRPRYLEAFVPAVAGCLGAGIALVAWPRHGATDTAPAGLPRDAIAAPAAPSPPRAGTTALGPHDAAVAAPAPARDSVAAAPLPPRDADAPPPRRPGISAPPRRPGISAPPRRPSISAPPRRPSISAPPRRPSISAPPRRPDISAPLRRGVAAAAAAVLAVSALVSVGAVRAHAQDSGTVGALPADRVAALSAFLRAHQGGARYELASLSVSPAAPLIVRDGRPVLLLSADSRTLVRPPELARLVATGQVRYALIGRRERSPGALRLVSWVRAHGTDVGGAVGFSPGSLFALEA